MAAVSTADATVAINAASAAAATVERRNARGFLPIL
jgi:hypothetical protein